MVLISLYSLEYLWQMLCIPFWTNSFDRYNVKTKYDCDTCKYEMRISALNKCIGCYRSGRFMNWVMKKILSNRLETERIEQRSW